MRGFCRQREKYCHGFCSLSDGLGCRGLLLPRPARVSYIYQNAARKLVSPLENWEAARASTGIIQGRSLCGSAGGVYFKMKVKTEKAWTFCPAPACDRTQIAHFHEKQLLTGTGCLNKLVYSGRVFLCQGIWWCRKKGENASVQPQTSTSLKK